MISKIDSNYDAICKLFNFSKETTTDINKKLLLQMAKNGEDRPHWKLKISKSLTTYTSKKNKTYDPVFTEQIKKLRPDWFKK